MSFLISNCKTRKLKKILIFGRGTPSLLAWMSALAIPMPPRASISYGRPSNLKNIE